MPLASRIGTIAPMPPTSVEPPAALDPVVVTNAAELFWSLMERGGPVMWPILLLSIISVALVIERAWFWHGNHAGARVAWLSRLGAALRKGDRSTCEKLLRRNRTIYGRIAERLLDEGATESVALDAVEQERPRIDRFMNMLSTIVTAAPMLGILGTVTGIIKSFDLMGQQSGMIDPRLVSGGIAEALLTTAAGLVVALLTLFPFMAFRVQSERALGRIESLIAAARAQSAAAPPGER